MPQTIQNLIEKYVSEIQKIYGNHLRQVVVYGSYTRGDYTSESDVDIMILLDLSDMEIKNYRYQLLDMTFDFNMDYGLDVKPIAKSEEHFMKWMENYPFYSNVRRDGVLLYGKW